MRSILVALLVFAGCSRDSVADPAHKDPTPTKDTHVPTLRPVTPADTTRYEAWLKKQNKATTETMREDTNLRINDWGFFDHFAGAGSKPSDYAGIDGAGHAVTRDEKSDWWAFLTTKGLDAAGAQRRAAFLFGGEGQDPTPNVKEVKAPTLTVGKDSAKAVLFFMIPGPGSKANRLTIASSPSGTKITVERL
jgi:hypothetical protein